MEMKEYLAACIDRATTSNRPSHEGLDTSRIFKDNYPDLPEELKEFNYYYDNAGDTGHVIMAVPECFVQRAEEKGDFYSFECPFPVRYVLAKGYRIYKGFVICEGEYDPDFGLIIDEYWIDM